MVINLLNDLSWLCLQCLLIYHVDHLVVFVLCFNMDDCIFCLMFHILYTQSDCGGTRRRNLLLSYTYDWYNYYDLYFITFVCIAEMTDLFILIVIPHENRLVVPIMIIFWVSLSCPMQVFLSWLEGVFPHKNLVFCRSIFCRSSVMRMLQYQFPVLVGKIVVGSLSQIACQWKEL